VAAGWGEQPIAYQKKHEEQILEKSLRGKRRFREGSASLSYEQWVTTKIRKTNAGGNTQ